MAFTDPQSITVAGSAKSMPRVESEGRRSLYKTNDGLFSLQISHQSVKSGGKDRVRSLVRFERVAVVPDPLTTVNDYENTQIQVVFDRPLAGFSSTEINDLMAGLKTWLDSTNVGKIYG